MPNARRSNPTRRQFCRTAGGAAATLFSFRFIPSSVWGANSRLALAAIGTGGKGASDIKGAVGAGFQVVALCDTVDATKMTDKGGRMKGIAESRQAYPDAKFYSDWREMLADKSLDFDAVTVATPDHHHAHASIAAMRAGKHVYTQKPLAHSVWEARAMAKVAAETGVKTQMGNQAHANDHMRRVVELIRAGIIGKVKQVHAWTNRPIWPQGFDRYPDAEAVPPWMNWDAWIGPAAPVDYSSHIAPFNWRGYWNFGCGALGDMACHIMDVAFWALELGSPTTIKAEAEGGTPISAPINSTITYVFPARGDRPAVKFVWYDGQKGARFDASAWKLIPGEPNLPSKAILEGFDITEANGYDCMFVGEKGKLFFNRSKNNWVVKSTSAIDGFAWPPPSLPRATDQNPYKEWRDAIDGKIPQAASHFGHAGPFTEMVLLGCVAQRAPGKDLQWDGTTLTIKNAPELQGMIHREYRKGWELKA
ncbi:MAG TPA: Gfo/Idh/MocA family oxidoreductase [Verrucomicrobiae bacterium]|nr:Gfo/Idh/MocA family oxidoreductase [Verrucomicrobiae bacterium]